MAGNIKKQLRHKNKLDRLNRTSIDWKMLQM